MADQDKRISVYYDGTCNLCSGIIERIDGSTRSDSFRAIKASPATLPPDISYSTAMRDIHVVDEAGSVYKGPDAIFRIMQEYRWGRYVAWVGKLPGVYALSRMAYRFTATHRYRIFGKNEVS